MRLTTPFVHLIFRCCHILVNIEDELSKSALLFLSGLIMQKLFKGVLRLSKIILSIFCRGNSQNSFFFCFDVKKSSCFAVYRALKTLKIGNCTRYMLRTDSFYWNFRRAKVSNAKRKLFVHDICTNIFINSMKEIGLGNILNIFHTGFLLL